MSNIRTKGYDDITFWQEEGIGLVVLRTPEDGILRPNVINELITSLGTASIDEKVKAIAITGINDNFSRGISLDHIAISNAQDLLESANALVSIIYSLEKPIFSILNGDANDFGYEIALLADEILSSGAVNVGFNPGYKFMLGGSLTVTKFRKFQIGSAKEGYNVDKIFRREHLLEDCKKYILEKADYQYYLVRRHSMRNIKEAMMEEKDAYLRFVLRRNK